MSARALVRTETVLRALINRFRAGRPRRPADEPRRILIAHHLLLGDTLMLTPLLAKLREKWPRAEIVMTVPAVCAELYGKKPYGVEAIGFNPRKRETLVGLWSKGPFDLAIVPGDNRFGWLAGSMGAKWMIGFEGDTPASKNLPFDDLRAFPANPTTWGEAVSTLVDGPPPQPYSASSWPEPEFEEFALPEPPFAVLHLGASSPLKLWPSERWMELAARLRGQGYTPVWSGGPGEEPLVSQADPTAKSTSYAGKIDLAQLWHLIANASILICPDTGVAHLGRLIGTPTLTLFGPGSPVICGAGDFWKDQPYRALVVEPMACRNQKILFRRSIDWVERCGRGPSECGYPRCMHGIETDTVFDEALGLLSQPRRVR